MLRRIILPVRPEDGGADNAQLGRNCWNSSWIRAAARWYLSEYGQLAIPTEKIYLTFSVKLETRTCRNGL
jgi:hypothetical protein